MRAKVQNGLGWQRRLGKDQQKQSAAGPNFIPRNANKYNCTWLPYVGQTLQMLFECHHWKH